MNRFTQWSAKGVTLIELLIAIALVSIVFTVLFSLFFYGNNTFIISSSQYDLQSEVRLAMDIIIKEVRFASYLELINVSEACDTNLHESGFSYFYLSDGKLFHVKYDKTSNLYHTFTYGSHINTASSIFSKINPTTLKLKILSEHMNKAYNGQTEISLLNLKADGNSIIGSDNLGLKYMQN